MADKFRRYTLDANNGITTVVYVDATSGSFTDLTVTGNTILGDSTSVDTTQINGVTAIDANSATAALRVTQIGSGNALLIEDSANPDATPVLVDATGKVVHGHTAALATFAGSTNTPGVQMVGTTVVNTLGLARFSISASSSPVLVGAKSDGAAVGTYTAVVADDLLFRVRAEGSDGTDFAIAGAIDFEVDGAVSADIVPGRAVIKTADSTGTLVAALRVTSAQDVAMRATKRLYLDGVAATGDTYIVSPSANVLDLFAGGVNTLRLSATAATVTGNLTLTGDAAVNGGDITSSATTFNLLNATVTTLNVGGAATAVNMGAGAASILTASFTTQIALNTAAVTSNQTTVALFNSVVTTLNVGGAATAVNIGAATGTTTIANALVGTIATDATSATTGAWKTAGGLGVAKALWVGGLANIAGALAVSGNTALGDALTDTVQITATVGINGAAPTGNFLRVLQNTATVADRGRHSTVFIQRQVGFEESETNPKALRVHTEVNTATVQNEWAVSGSVDFNTSATGAGNCVAVSGVTNRHSATTTNTAFAGHFQVKDWNAYAAATDVAPCVGTEMNLAVYGLDHPTANGNNGRRIVLHLISHNNPDIAATNAETGRGLVIATASGANGGYFRTALHIEESSGNANTIAAAIKIQTSGAYGLRMLTGAHSTADISLESDSLYGIILNGAYTNAALRINDNQYIGLRANNTIKARYNTSTSRFELDVSGTLRFEVELDATPIVLLNGTQVIKTRETGWTAGTGTPVKGAFAAYAGATMSAGYVQAEAQATNDAAKAASQRLLAIEQALINHGLIGA